MGFDQRLPFSFADQPAAEGRAEIRSPSLLDLAPEMAPGDREDLATLMRDPQPTPAAPSDPAPVER